MATFGASDILANSKEMVPFAFIEYNRSGGLTQIFSVPYPVWVLNTTVTANLTPQYGDFRMVLCYASNGSIINGEEILNRGSSLPYHPDIKYGRVHDYLNSLYRSLPYHSGNRE